MKRSLNYILVFVCAFLLFGSVLPVGAVEPEYDVYQAGEKITKTMSNGKTVSFTVVKDEGVNSKYVKAIANPSDLQQFGITTAYSYNDISASSWDTQIESALKVLEKSWEGKVRTGSIDYNIAAMSKSVYDELLNEYSNERYGKEYAQLESTNKTAVDAAIKEALKDQTFWTLNFDGSNVLQSDRVLNGAYTTDALTEDAKSNKMNVTFSCWVCKEAKVVKKCKYDKDTKKFYGSDGKEVTEAEYKKQCEPAGNPNTADRNNILVLSVIAAGCVICIVTLSKKMLAK